MTQIKMLTGVVEVGLFCHMAQAAYFGNEVRTSIPLSPVYFITDFVLLFPPQDGSVTVRWNDGTVKHVEAPQ